MTEILTTENLVALLTLTALEVVLGVDNVIVIAIVTGRLPEAQRARARRIGLLLAMFMRVGLLLAITWIMGLEAVLFNVDFGPFDQAVTGKDLILIVGGLFLIAKSTKEIHHKLEGADEQAGAHKAASFSMAIAQILALDAVFSLDSVITAVGMAKEIWVMIVAVVVAVAVMMAFAGRISGFVERHPTIKMLALSFLILIGVLLLAEGFGQHVGRGYIYFAMAFSLGVELLNMRARLVMERRRAGRAASTPEIGD